MHVGVMNFNGITHAEIAPQSSVSRRILFAFGAIAWNNSVTK